VTGPGPGKILIRDAESRIVCKETEIPLEGVEIYIHLKGYSFARVTHLDIEHSLLNEIIDQKEGGYFRIYNFMDRIRIKLDPPRKLKYKGSICKAYYIEVISKVFKSLLNRRKYIITWVGGKLGGIYIGFRKEQIRKLETIAREMEGI
jgi:hypothetical protein